MSPLRYGIVRVLIAGVGNVLRGDDGFGVEVAARLLRSPLPEGVRVVEMGIGGIHLVQELLEPVDALVVVDAVDLGRPPGTVVVLRPQVLDVWGLPSERRRDQLADMHYATPERAFMLASALGILPQAVWVVGCQPADAERLGEGLSPPVMAAMEPALTELRKLVSELGVPWT